MRLWDTSPSLAQSTTREPFSIAHGLRNLPLLRAHIQSEGVVEGYVEERQRKPVTKDEKLVVKLLLMLWE